MKQRKTAAELADLVRGKGPLPMREMDNIDYMFAASARAIIAAHGGDEKAAGFELKTISLSWAQAARTRDAEKTLIASIGERFKKTEAARTAIRRAIRDKAPAEDFQALAIELTNAIEGVDGDMPEPLGKGGVA